MTGFVYPDAPTVSFVGAPDGSPAAALAGKFMGTLTDDGAVAGGGTTLLGANGADAASTSFTAWCTDLTHEFSFNTNYQYQSMTGASYYSNGATLTALSRLFTAAQGFVVDSATSAAMQAGIWEILYETGASYNIMSGSFSVGASDAATTTAFGTVNSYLARLSTYNASYTINVLASDSNQDFLVATVPEPSTWALLIAGIGAIGYVGRRRHASPAERFMAPA